MDKIAAGSTTSGGVPARWPPPAAAELPPASPTPDPPATLTVLGAGDVLIHLPVWEQAAADAGGTGFDFYPIFADLRPMISGADLVICHLETPLAPASGPFQGFPTFLRPAPAHERARGPRPGMKASDAGPKWT